MWPRKEIGPKKGKGQFDFKLPFAFLFSFSI